MRFRRGDGNCNCDNSRGNVLPLVLGVLLVISILLSAMLRMPGTLRRAVSIVADETQEMYLAESAVLAKLEGFPDGYFVGLPAVESRVRGPWTEWRIRSPVAGCGSKLANVGCGKNEFQFILGNAYSRFSTSEWVRCAVLLERNLQEFILQAEGLQNFSGSRRFFKLDSTMANRGAVNVSAGDLTLDLNCPDAFRGSLRRSFGNSLDGSDALGGSFCNSLGGSGGGCSVRSFMANVEGDVKIRGDVHFDTLRIYASGTVTLQGNVSVGFVEIFGFAGVSVTGEASLSGVLLSKQSVEISRHAKMKFPSVAIAVGYRGNRLALREKSVFEGLAIAPSGIFERDSSTVLLDSSKTLLPFCMESRKIVFKRRRL